MNTIYYFDLGLGTEILHNLTLVKEVKYSIYTRNTI